MEINTTHIKLIETAVLIVAYIVIKIVASKTIEKVGKKFLYHKSRIKIVKKIVNVLLFFIISGFILFVWGVEQSELVVFISSFLTVMGIALFAQWSIVSNITSAVIIFFNHPVKIGDSIVVLDKDYQVEGKISDIGMFFMIIKSTEGEQISIPTNVFMNKMVKKKNNE
ncbi:MAG: mechanosensitive ion channel [Bacteroidetes bacterium]|nr:MAG: mechanosensitive ion channel [Bacteroidota bacterium]